MPYLALNTSYIEGDSEKMVLSYKQQSCQKRPFLLSSPDSISPLEIFQSLAPASGMAVVGMYDI